MSFLELAEKRYSVRKFRGQKVEREKIDQLAKAIMLAPTAHNEQPQRVLILQREEDLAKLKDCTPCHFNAPLTLLVCYDTQSSWKREYDGHISGEVDASIIGAHIMFTATDLGLGCTWVMHFDPAAVRKAYGLPDNYVPAALFPIGYPAEDSKPAPLHTQSLDEKNIIFYDRFDG